jgi:hypothetical protein
MDGRSTGSHDSEKFGTKSTKKQGGMAFGLWETATVVIELDREIDNVKQNKTITQNMK